MDIFPKLESCERLRGTGIIEVWQDGKLKQTINTKDTTMKTSVSYSELKAAGAGEKLLIWFYAAVCGVGVMDKWTIENIKSIITSRAAEIREIYNCNPHDWIDWLDKHFPQKQKITMVYDFTYPLHRWDISCNEPIPIQTSTDIKRFAEWLYNAGIAEGKERARRMIK